MRVSLSRTLILPQQLFPDYAHINRRLDLERYPALYDPADTHDHLLTGNREHESLSWLACEGEVAETHHQPKPLPGWQA